MSIHVLLHTRSFFFMTKKKQKPKKGEKIHINMFLNIFTVFNKLILTRYLKSAWTCVLKLTSYIEV